MRHIFLVARHEFIQTITQPAFYIAILIFIGAMILGATVPRYVEKSLRKTVEVSIVDLAGDKAEGLERALTRDVVRLEMGQLNHFVRENLKPEYQENLPAQYEKNSRTFSEKDIAQYREIGREGYLREAMTYVREEAVPPEMQQLRFAIKNATAEFERAEGDIATKVTSLLKAPGETAPKKRVLLVIPEEFEIEDPHKAPIAIWSLETLGPELAAGLRNDVDDFFAYEGARGRGELDVVARFESAHGDVRFHALDKADRSEGRKEIDFVPWLIEKLPIGLLLLVVILVTTQSVMLLTNTIEEKSNRIVEVMLSSMSPQHFMMGKLLGPMLITLFVGVLISIGGTVATMIFATVSTPDAAQVQQATATIGTSGANDVFKDVVEPLLAGLLPKIPGALLYFILAYLTYAGLFLAVGALCTELRQIQSVAAPLNLSLLGLGGLSMVAAFEPDQSLAHILTWIPLTSPFVMIGRLGSDVAWWEYAGTITIQCAVIYLLLSISGRVFKRAALRSGGLPGLKEIRAMIAGRD